MSPATDLLTTFIRTPQAKAVSLVCPGCGTEISTQGYVHHGELYCCRSCAKKSHCDCSLAGMELTA